MRVMTKSTILLAREAMRVGQLALPAYRSRFSKHDFTQPQLFALLVLRQFLRPDYRGRTTLLSEWRELRAALRLTKVPHYSTLCYAEQRLFAGAEKRGPSASSSTGRLSGRTSLGSSAPRSSPPSMQRGSSRAMSASTSRSAVRRASRASFAASTGANATGRSSRR